MLQPRPAHKFDTVAYLGLEEYDHEGRMDRVVNPSFNGHPSTHPALVERWLAVNRLALFLALLPFGIKAREEKRRQECGRNQNQACTRRVIAGPSGGDDAQARHGEWSDPC